LLSGQASKQAEASMAISRKIQYVYEIGLTDVLDITSIGHCNVGCMLRNKAENEAFDIKVDPLYEYSIGTLGMAVAILDYNYDEWKDQ
jgi:hypothetical protein